jgi:hypothetical protein
MFSTALSGSVFSEAFLVGVDVSSSQPINNNIVPTHHNYADRLEVYLRALWAKLRIYPFDALQSTNHRSHPIVAKCVIGSSLVPTVWTSLIHAGAFWDITTINPSLIT